jgi:mRNA interferase RelE/StbE
MSDYDLLIEPQVHDARKQLPGNMRQQIKRAIDGLASNPRPAQSEAMDVSGLDVPSDVEVRRLKLILWRLIYAVNDVLRWVWVLALRRRPPYDYSDLPELISKLKE